jgi:hypothetical protein
VSLAAPSCTPGSGQARAYSPGVTFALKVFDLPGSSAVTPPRNSVGGGPLISCIQSFRARYPERDLAVAVLCNVANASAPSLAREVADLFLGGEEQDAPKPKPARVAPALLAARRGERAGFRRISDGDTIRYEPVADFAPTPAQLAEYAGTYESDEAERVRRAAPSTSLPGHARDLAPTSAPGLVQQAGQAAIPRTQGYSGDRTASVGHLLLVSAAPAG